EFDELRTLATSNDDVVECETGGAWVVAGDEFGAEQRALFDPIPADGDAIDRFPPGGAAEAGEKTKRSEIDAEDDRHRVADIAHRFQQGAVAAEDEQQFAPARQFMAQIASALAE